MAEPLSYTEYLILCLAVLLLFFVDNIHYNNPFMAFVFIIYQVTPLSSWKCQVMKWKGINLRFVH